VGGSAGAVSGGGSGSGAGARVAARGIAGDSLRMAAAGSADVAASSGAAGTATTARPGGTGLSMAIPPAVSAVGAAPETGAGSAITPLCSSIVPMSQRSRLGFTHR